MERELDGFELDLLLLPMLLFSGESENARGKCFSTGLDNSFFAAMTLEVSNAKLLALSVSSFPQLPCHSPSLSLSCSSDRSSWALGLQSN
jgi:hypothetical protein